MCEIGLVLKEFGDISWRMGIHRGYLGNVHEKAYDFWEKGGESRGDCKHDMKRGRKPGSQVDGTAIREGR